MLPLPGSTACFGLCLTCGEKGAWNADGCVASSVPSRAPSRRQLLGMKSLAELRTAHCSVPLGADLLGLHGPGLAWDVVCL